MSAATAKRVACAAIMLAITACTVNPGFNQLDLLKRWSKYKTKAELEAQLWTAKIGDYEQLAIPVQHDGIMTFYMKDGTEIDFLGWDVTALRNWNYYGKEVEISRTESRLSHYLLNESVVELECTAYKEVSEGFLKEGTVRSAYCEEQGGFRWNYTNGVVLDDQGAAIWMLHHVSPNMPPLELRLNRSPDTDFLEYSDHIRKARKE